MKIEYSTTASVVVNDSFYSAFERNSYIARVTFEDDFVVCLVLPENAANSPTHTWDLHVRLNAEYWRTQDERFYPHASADTRIARLLK